MNWKKVVVAAVVCSLLIGALVALAGCGSGKPQVIIFMSPSSKSYDATKAMVDEAKKKYGDKVTITVYDYNKASSAAAKKKYFVSMNPTIIIANAQGQTKQTYMGLPMKDEFLSTIQSFIPTKGGATSTPTSTPGSVNVPGTPVPPGASPVPSTTPIVPVPNQ